MLLIPCKGLEEEEDADADDEVELEVVARGTGRQKALLTLMLKWRFV
jgi:hypothetical protein